MLKFIIALCATLGLAGCAGQVDREALADAAIAQIKALNAAGIDYVQLSDEHRLILISACAVAQTPGVTTVPDDVAAACAVAVEASKGLDEEDAT